MYKEIMECLLKEKEKEEQKKKKDRIRKKTQRMLNIFKLFKGIGIRKIINVTDKNLTMLMTLTKEKRKKIVSEVNRNKEEINETDYEEVNTESNEEKIIEEEQYKYEEECEI
ncbi:hypothetical protein RclHR1_00220031 [Rhizophagus clarus]|uniref:Uncharacterized protein n=1 Tax=Rhizophagus clarus TaxID=94130 RepID=A0A2Z6QTS5_9GLOM|nr:hypothetical protein RclHR1_00220031 [Rhizophagus clarus]GES84575.1 hypothetical protein RCL_jg11369.t1 [Rhizophagus clarus]